MLIIYGEESEIAQCHQFLNAFSLFSNDVYPISVEKLPFLNNLENVFKEIDKVFIYSKNFQEDKLKENLISLGCPLEKICTIDEHKKLLGLILYDIQLNVQDHKILSSFLCEFNDFLKVYSNILIEKYNMKKKYDIAFAFLSKGHEEHILPLAQEVEKYFNSVNFFQEDNNKYTLKNSIDFKGNNLFLDLARLNSLNNFDILISANTMTNTNAINIGVAHTLTTKPTNRLDLFRGYEKVDYTFITNKRVFDEAKDLLVEYQHLLKKEVCLVPFGYPKLDKVVSDLEQYKDQPRDAICYAPTILMHDKEFRDTLSLNEGVKVIGELLDNFSYYKIIFRPHPKTISYNAGKEYVEEILNRYSNHPNFIYDSDSYHIKTFSRTKLLISDFSGVAQTFAFATNQPVLSLSKDGFDEQYKKVLKGDDIRKNFGLVLNDIDQLVEKTKYILDHQDKFYNQITAYKEDQMFNFGNTAKYFIDNIEYIKSGKKHPDWFYIGAKE